jgi:hypothetical protein
MRFSVSQLKSRKERCRTASREPYPGALKISGGVGGEKVRYERNPKILGK